MSGRRGAASLAHGLVAVGIALGVLGLGTPARAEGPRPVLVLGGDPAAEVLTERLRGQLSDLDVVVAHVDGSPTEATLAARADEATTCAQGREGALVVWADASPPDGHVYLLDVDAQLLFSRALGSLEMGSAAIESAAVVLRTAVQAALAGQPLGVPEAEALAASAPPAPAPSVDAPSPAPAPEAGIEPGPATAAPAPRDALALRLGLGWRGEIDGVSSAGAHGVFLDVAILLGPLVIGLRVDAGIPIDVQSADARFALSRHALVVEAAYRAELVDAFALEIGAGVGVAAYDRESALVSAGLIGTTTSWSFAAAIAVLTRWVWSPTEWLSAWVALGAEMPLPRPTFVLRRPGGDTVEADPFPVAPRLELGVALRIFP